MPGRRSTIGTHPQREVSEAGCAAGSSLRKVTIRFGLVRMSLYRYWHNISSEHRGCLVVETSNLDNSGWREVTASLAMIARRHPGARAGLNALVQCIRGPVISPEMGDHAHDARNHRRSMRRPKGLGGRLRISGRGAATAWETKSREPPRKKLAERVSSGRIDAWHLLAGSGKGGKRLLGFRPEADV
jgi:hypothetical protein